MLTIYELLSAAKTSVHAIAAAFEPDYCEPLPAEIRCRQTSSARGILIWWRQRLHAEHLLHKGVHIPVPDVPKQQRDRFVRSRNMAASPASGTCPHTCWTSLSSPVGRWMLHPLEFPSSKSKLQPSSSSQRVSVTAEDMRSSNNGIAMAAAVDNDGSPGQQRKLQELPPGSSCPPLP